MCFRQVDAQLKSGFLSHVERFKRRFLADTTETVNANGPSDGAGPRVHRKALRNHGNLVLILVTASFVTTWTPTALYFTLQIFLGVNWPYYFEIVTVIFALQPVVDPILFILALKTIRDELCRLCGF